MLVKKNDGYSLYFLTATYQRAPDNDNYIKIVPSRGDWNDFGYLSKVDISVYSKNYKHEISLKGYIGFLNSEEKKNGKSELIRRVENEKNVNSSSKEFNDYFVMLQDMNDYRMLVNSFGVYESKKILDLINDVISKKNDAKSEMLRKKAISTEVFNKSFIRETESYFTFKNAESVLSGVQYEELGKLSQNIKISYTNRVNNEDVSYIFNFDHEHDLPKRISILIGENGVGKSQTLKEITLAAIKGTNNLVAVVDPESGNVEERIQISRLLAFSPTNESKSSFPTDKRKRSLIWYKRLSLNRVAKSTLNLNDSIVQLARSKGSIGYNYRWDIFINALNALNANNDLVIKCSGGNSSFVKLKEINSRGEEARLSLYAEIPLYGEPLRLINDSCYPLSSGEISFIKFCAQVCLYIENGTLLLIDEPETHLHPSFINKFMALLDSLLEMTGSSAIIATHSVYLVREVFKEQVTILKRRDDGVVVSEKPRLSTFGANIGNISYFVFGESEPTQLLKKVRSKIKRKKMTWSDVESKYSNDLSVNVLTSLRNELDK
ncbi:AAA family ATPase [Enterobacter pseudoroggenkampii]|uniref:AAA family ATPase n=1 Tax=Enterobacter pseudoroggenkampii TaxID=2996112 RepID=UPI0038B0DC12